MLAQGIGMTATYTGRKPKADVPYRFEPLSSLALPTGIEPVFQP